MHMSHMHIYDRNYGTGLDTAFWLGHLSRACIDAKTNYAILNIYAISRNVNKFLRFIVKKQRIQQKNEVTVCFEL